MVGGLVSLPGLQLAGKRLCLQALDLYLSQNISFADAYNAVYMQERRIKEIYSWDNDFDGIEGILRVEPLRYSQPISCQ